MRRAAILFLAWIIAIGAQPRERISWLDAPPKQWNKAGGNIPRARNPDKFYLEMCKAEIEKPKTPEESAVVGRGWMLFGSSVVRGITVVSGTESFDGMCRPDLYQDFVFVKGMFAGTLSPGAMNSRGDGSEVAFTFPAPDKIQSEFHRYTEKDPRCCPSRISEATYEIQDVLGKPVVALVAVRTRPAN